MELLETLLKQEKDLQFSSFSSEDAWEIGQVFVKKGLNRKLAITIDITVNHHQLFHYSFTGTSPDNDNWIKRKINVVNRFFHSSYYMGRELDADGVSLEEKYLLSSMDYATHGGCFPIILKGTGVVGTITVSGLAQEDDHQLVVEVIGEYLRR